MRFAIGLSIALLSSCVSDLREPGPESTELTAQDAWLNLALPALTDCRACHDGSANTSIDQIGFLAGGNELKIRDTLLESGRVNLADKFNSAIFTKGIHQGNVLTADQVYAIMVWLDAE